MSQLWKIINRFIQRTESFKDYYLYVNISAKIDREFRLVVTYYSFIYDIII